MPEDFVAIGCVRITPPRIEFTESVYTKKYQSRFSIQNVGKNKVFIKIPQTDTKDFQIDFLPRGLYLSPGLRIVKYVKLNYSKQCSKECMISILINEEKYDYLMILKPSTTTISIHPRMLDFGLMNAGTVHVSHMLVVENNGGKDQTFIVDMTNCSENIIVEPTKGRIKAHAIYEIGVRVIGFAELVIDSQFQIKCAHQIIPIPVKGKIIISKFEAMHPNATPHFTLLEFPPTYFGLTSETYLFIRNYSAISYMFSTMGEIHHKRVSVSDMKKKSTNFKFFNTYPMDGVFQSNETKVFTFRFSPIELDATTKYTAFYFCTMLMHRFKCASLNKENVVDFNLDLMSYMSHCRSSSCEPSLRSSETNVLELFSSCHYILDEAAYYKFNLESVHDFIRIHLYATAEVPSVQIVPDEIHIKDMQPKKYETRTLELKNLSRHLPIIFKYKKSPFIILSDDKLYLRPLEKIEIGVKIDPVIAGTSITNLTFDLMYYDMPKVDNKCKVIGQVKVMVKIDMMLATKYPIPQLNLGLSPNYIKDVGKYCHGIKFNTKLRQTKCITVRNITRLSKTCTDLVAFPNDTRQSLRPYRSPVMCRTIFTRQSRYIAPIESQYELQVAEVSRKSEIKDYYTNYMRQQLITHSRSCAAIGTDYKEYDVTMMEKILCDDVKMYKSPAAISYQKQKRGLYFLPLTPQEMNNVYILPPIIKTEPIASYSAYQFQIKIVNKNNVPIRVLLCSDRLNLSYDEGNRHIVGKKQEMMVKITYKSASCGYYTSNLYMIVNDSSVLNVPILADVISHSLVVDCREIVLENKNDHKYIELKNIVNIDLPYYWDHNHQHFIIEPNSGIINAGRKIVCVVSHHQEIEGPTKITANLLSGHINSETIKISVKDTPNELFLLLKDINFSAIPLNEPIRDMIIVKNCHFVSVKYYIREEDLPKGLTVFPLTGNVEALGQAHIYITAQFENCYKFYYLLKIYNYHGGVLEVPVHGTVIYPEVVITPSVINIAKIPGSTVTNAEFIVKNISCVKTKIRFDMAEYEEFLISDSELSWAREQITEFYLQSHSTRTLYIHYLPKGASSCLFYLPMVINDILGPPLYMDVTSTRTNYYLIDFADHFKVLDTPKYIPCIKVRTLATQAKINISKTFLEFKTLPIHREAFSAITILNPQHVPEQVCIRTDELEHPIYMERIGGIKEVFQKNALVLYLNPNDSITFKISFIPQFVEFGKYRVQLPLYLRSDNSTKEHNVITIAAEYKRPGISIKFSDAKYFQEASGHLKSDYMYCHYPLPLSFKERCIKLELTGTDHLENCEITTKAQCENKTFKWTLQKDTKTIIDAKGTYTVIVDSTFTDLVSFEHRDVYEVTCTCGGHWVVRGGGAVENSLLTAYEDIEYYFKQNAESDRKQFTTYPLFPTKSHKYIDFFIECCKCAETWIQTQVCFGMCGYFIPDAISFPCLEAVPEQAIARQTQLSRLPILHILGNLLGPDAVAAAKQREIPTEEIEKIKALYEVNQKAIELVKKQGATLTMIRPEHLLSLTHFFIYYEKIYDNREYPYPQSLALDDLDGFYRYSKQTWLDFTLQIYKSLYLNKLVDRYKMLATEGKLKDTPLSAFFAVTHEPVRADMYSDSESLILNWLQFHYDTYKTNFWRSDCFLADIKVDFYNDSLNDGIVFAVVIATYCPYLISRMKDMYLPATTNEEVYHNILSVIQCLEMLNYTFIITAEQIIQGNSIRLLMFSVYLFEVLPHMYPVETITIYAGLSTVGVEKLEIFNENNFPIAYKPIFIGSEQHGCFTTTKEVLEIPKRKKLIINISYFAKFAKNLDSVLLLSGEILGFRYANNKCINLIGIPDLNYAVTTIVYEQELFKAECYDFVVQSPYKVIATYDMQQTYDVMHYPLELSSVIYHLDRDRIASARVVVLNKSFDFDKNGECVAHSVIGTLANATIQSWLYFRNPTVGDFAIKFVSLIKDNTQRELLKVQTVNKNRDCLNGLFLLIPNRNRLFFNCMKSLLVKLTEEDDSELWKRITETDMGLNILENLFTTTPLDTQRDIGIRCKSGIYKVHVDNDVDVILPDTIMFEDEYNAGFVKLPLTLKTPNEYPKDFYLTLESEDSLRKRYYTVSFIND